MRTTSRFLVLATISVSLSACGGGGGRSQQVQIPDPPAAPVVTVGADIKQMIFSWDEAHGANYYRFLENPDGHSGFTQVGENIPRRTLSFRRQISVHLQDWVNAMYLVQACNTGGCTDSVQVSATDLMLDAIGYFKASNTGAGDRFGNEVALSADGHTLAVAAFDEDSNATGVNGIQSDNSISRSGAVYVFYLDDTGWSQQAYIKASNPDVDDSFGRAMALSADGRTLAVGSYFEDSSATGINGDQDDNSKNSAGAVYLFRFDGVNWFQQAYIKASDTWGGDHFGRSVALSEDGNTLAVGAFFEDSGATGVNGNQSDFSASSSGAVYVFRYSGANWTQQAYIKASNTDSGDKFGLDVALSKDGQTLAVASWREGSSATGINGDQLDNATPNAGAVYLFHFDGTNWSQRAYVKASNTGAGDSFGFDLALSADGGTLAVGAPFEAGGVAGINGDQSDDSMSEAGAVYIFRYDGTDWKQEAYVKASNPAINDLFGASVAVSADGNWLVVGAFGESGRAIGINGDQHNRVGGGSGAAYVFRFDGTVWSQKAYVKSSNTAQGDMFAETVSMSWDGETIAVGASQEDGSDRGINGFRHSNLFTDAGAVYVY